MDKTSCDLGALRLEPQYHQRVWGDHHLKADSPEPIGEAWIVFEGDTVASGPHAGQTLSQLAEQYGPLLLGSHPAQNTGNRFPLLIKLLDCAQWLSVQVHPNDEQARSMEGPEHFGKTEAWHILDAEEGARLISGLQPGTTQEALEDAIRTGKVVDLAHYVDVKAGDTIMTYAGTMHAIGPGLFIYEIQQTSDITYRVYDWDRPQTGGRKLHIEQSVAVTDPGARGEPRHLQPLREGERQTLVSCPYFKLDLVAAETETVYLDTGGETFHAITVIEGNLVIEGDGWREELGLYETVVVPACCRDYRILPSKKYRALLAGVV